MEKNKENKSKMKLDDEVLGEVTGGCRRSSGGSCGWCTSFCA